MRTGSRLFACRLLIEIPQSEEEDIQRFIDVPALWVGEFVETWCNACLQHFHMHLIAKIYLAPLIDLIPEDKGNGT